MRRFTMTVLTGFWLTSLAHAQVYNFFYSTADSILYWDVQDYDLEHWILFAVQNGGASMERVTSEAPGDVVMSDGIPGSIYAYHDSVNGLRYWDRSCDYGESWLSAPQIPSGILSSFSGAEPGQCWAERMAPIQPHYVYLTVDSWQTVDSLPVNVYLDGGTDSLHILSLSHQIGTLYGQRFSDRALCISSDTSQTWHSGGTIPAHVRPVCGAVDEFWWFGRQLWLCVALDTGRTVDTTVFQPHLPSRPWSWNRFLLPTDLPGEAYYVCAWEDWPPPPHWMWTELIIYHIREYGAVVDSFYYSGYDFNFESGISPPRHIPTSFSVRAFPNPFNSAITFDWSVPFRSAASVVITDVLGRVVWTWCGSEQYVRWNSVNSSGTGVSSGKYFVTVHHNFQQTTVPIILLR